MTKQYVDRVEIVMKETIGVKGEIKFKAEAHVRNMCTKWTRHDKTCLCHMPKTMMQISLRIYAVWSASVFFTSKYSTFKCYSQNFKTPVRFWRLADRFET